MARQNPKRAPAVVPGEISPHDSATGAIHKTELPYGGIYGYIAPLKTTIDLPDDLLLRAKMVAAQRQTTLKELIIGGLDWMLRPEAASPDHQAGVARLQKGLRLGGQPLSRAQAHERQ